MQCKGHIRGGAKWLEQGEREEENKGEEKKGKKGKNEKEASHEPIKVCTF
jgi:hypothetical protein